MTGAIKIVNADANKWIVGDGTNGFVKDASVLTVYEIVIPATTQKK